MILTETTCPHKRHRGNTPRIDSPFRTTKAAMAMEMGAKPK